MGSGAIKEVLPQGAFEATQEPGDLAPEIANSARAAPSLESAHPVSLPLSAFPEREYVDLKRAAHILGVSDQNIICLYQAGLIEMIDYAPRKRKRVRYQSIVDFCDSLRTKYCIRDRRPALGNSMFRHRDEDLLPFPLTDTVGVQGAAEALGYVSPTPIRLMIEEGRFEAYQFAPWSPWRISKSSLATYMRAVEARHRQRPKRSHSRKAGRAAEDRGNLQWA